MYWFIPVLAMEGRESRVVMPYNVQRRKTTNPIFERKKIQARTAGMPRTEAHIHWGIVDMIAVMSDPL